MIRSLSNIFSDKVNIPIQTQDKDNLFLVVVEEGALSAIKRLFLQGLPSNSYAISLDVDTASLSEDDKKIFSRINHYLDKKNKAGINKRCDLVLFTESNGQSSVYIFDLKSSDPEPMDVCNQLSNSEIYIRYILELARFFYNVDVSRITFFKVIATTRVRKRVPYANVELREKVARKKALFDKYNIKEVTVLPDNKKGYLQFSELSRLF